jgi:hypothetical protein
LKSESVLHAKISSVVADGGFQAGKIMALSVAHFVHDAYSGFLAPLLPLLIEKLSMSLTQAGFLSTVMQIPALLNPYIGVLADRISVRYFAVYDDLFYGTIGGGGRGRIHRRSYRFECHLSDQCRHGVGGHTVYIDAAQKIKCTQFSPKRSSFHGSAVILGSCFIAFSGN